MPQEWKQLAKLKSNPEKENREIINHSFVKFKQLEQGEKKENYISFLLVCICNNHTGSSTPYAQPDATLQHQALSYCNSIAEQSLPNSGSFRYGKIEEAA